jgi:UDP-4-amino-4-deoxy-L-arabinose-oxoglutarate aminotransferase
MGYYNKKYALPIEKFKNSYFWGEETLSIPMFPGITTEQQDYVISVLLNQIDSLIGR